MREKVSQQLVDILDDDKDEYPNQKLDVSVVNLTPEDERNQKIRDRFILEDVPEWI